MRHCFRPNKGKFLEGSFFQYISIQMLNNHWMSLVSLLQQENVKKPKNVQK